LLVYYILYLSILSVTTNAHFENNSIRWQLVLSLDSGVLVVIDNIDRFYDCYTNGDVSHKAVILLYVKVIQHVAHLISGCGPSEILANNFLI